MLAEVGSMSKNILGDDSGIVCRNIRGGNRKDWRQKDVFKVRKQVNLRLNTI